MHVFFITRSMFHKKLTKRATAAWSFGAVGFFTAAFLGYQATTYPDLVPFPTNTSISQTRCVQSKTACSTIQMRLATDTPAGLLPSDANQLLVKYIATSTPRNCQTTVVAMDGMVSSTIQARPGTERIARVYKKSITVPNEMASGTVPTSGILRRGWVSFTRTLTPSKGRLAFCNNEIPIYLTMDTREATTGTTAIAGISMVTTTPRAFVMPQHLFNNRFWGQQVRY